VAFVTTFDKQLERRGRNQPAALPRHDRLSWFSASAANGETRGSMSRKNESPSKVRRI
jgi:hypothetical protein